MRVLLSVWMTTLLIIFVVWWAVLLYLPSVIMLVFSSIFTAMVLAIACVTHYNILKAAK